VVKVKVDFYGMKAHTGNIGIPPPFQSQHYMEGKSLVSRPGPFYFWRNKPLYFMNRSLGGPRVYLDV
jgi:hypothetical protein